MELLESRESDSRVIFTGVGKSGLVAAKISATFSSLGIPSSFLHSTEAAHGDLGTISSNDIIVCISHSGNTPELISIIPSLKVTVTIYLCLLRDWGTANSV